MTYFPHKLRLNEIESYGSSSPVVILNGASGQTANLTEWQDNLDNILASVGPTGSLALGINGSASSGSVADFGNYRKTAGVRSSVIGFEDGGNVANPKFSFTTAGMGITISDYIGSHVGTIYSNNSSQLIVEKTGGSYISLESTFAAAKRLRVIEAGDQLVPSVALSISSGFELGMYANAVGSSSARFTLSANRTSMLTVAQDSIGINNTNPSGARLFVSTGTASSVGQIIRATASQTANLLALQNSSGVNVLGADVTGKLQLDSTANSNSLTMQSVSTGYYLTAGSTAIGAGELHLRTGNNSDIHITPHNGGVVIGSGSYAAFNKWSIAYGDVSFYKNVGNVSSIRTGFMVNSHTSTTADAETGAIRFGTAYSDSVNHYALHIVDKVANAKIGISSTAAFDPSSLLHVQNNTAADKALIIQGASSQSANLTEWQDSSGTSLISISSAGVITGGVDNSTSMLLQSLGRTWVTFKRLNDGLYSGGIRWQGSTGINGWSLGHTTQGTELRLYDATGEVVTFEQGGNVGIGSTDPGAKLEIETGAAATKGLIVQAAVSQTANLTEWQDSSGTVIAYVAADGSSSFGGTTTVGDLNIESLGTADSVTTTYNSENLTWNGSYWDGAAAQNTNGVIKLATGVTENYFSLTPDDRTAGEYKFYPDELTVPGAIDVTGNATVDGNISNGTALNTNSTSNRIGIGTTVGSSVLEIGGDRVVGFTGGDGIIRAISGTLTLRDNTGVSHTIAGGNIRLAGANYTARLSVPTGSATDRGIVVRGYASQSANLQEWQDSSGAIRASIDPTGDLFINGDAAFGGTSLASHSIIVAAKNLTDPTEHSGGINCSRTVFLTAANAFNVIGTTSNISISSTTFAYTGTLKGALNQVQVSSTSTVAKARGSESLVYNTSTGTVAEAVGSYNTIQNLNAAGVITDAYCGYFNIGFNNGTFTNTYGVYVGDITSGTQTNQAYGLFVSDANARNHFAGTVGIGATSPGAKLEIETGAAATKGFIVQAAASQTANLTEWQNSSGTVLSSVTKDGYIGIGMTTSVPLAVNGEVRFGNMQNNASTFFIGSGGNVSINNASGQSVNDLSITSDSGAGYSAINVSQTGVGAGLTITNGAAATTGIIVKSHASQSASITEWQNSSGTAKVLITNKGNLQINAPFNSTRSIVFNRGATGDDSGVEFQTAGTKSWMFGHLGSTISATSNLYLTYYNGSADVSKISFNTSGRIFLGDGPNNGPQGMLEIATNAAGTKGLVVKGSASQTANLTEWQDSSGTVMAYVAADGSSSFSESSLENPTLTGTIHIDSDSVSHGGSNLCYNGAFEQGINGWTVVNGSGILTQESVSDAYLGSYVMRSVGNAWIIGDHSIPFDPNVLYRVEAVVRQTVEPTTGGKNVYVGVAGRNQADTFWVNTTGANGYSSQHYVAADPETSIVADGWVRYVGYIKGTAATGDGTAHTDPFDPAVVHENVRYIRPMVILNHVSGDGTAEVGYFKITAIGQSSAGLTSYGGVTGIGGNVGIGTTSPLYGIDVRGKSVNFGSVADVFDITNGVTRFSVTPKDNSLGNYFVINQKNFSNNATSAGITVDASTNGLIAIRGFATFSGSGVQSISGRLAIANNATTTIPLTVQGIASQTANLTEWKNSSGTVLSCIDEIGRIGIGTSDPATPLHVRSATGSQMVRIEGYGTDAKTEMIFDNDVASWTIGCDGTESDNFKITTGYGFGATPMFCVTTGGSVGIGTSTVSPGSKLHVYGGDLTVEDVTPVVSLNNREAAAIGSVTAINFNNTASATDFLSSIQAVYRGGTNNAAKYLEFYTGGDASTAKVVISGAGNVGIGETVPGAKLQVNTVTAATAGLIVKGAASQTANLTAWTDSSGAVLASVSSSGGITGVGVTSNGNMLSNGATAGHTIQIVPDNQNHNYIRMTSDNSLRNVGIDFINSASSITWGIANEYSTDGLVIGTSQVGNTNFGGFAVVTIKNTGNVGIGETVPGAKLQVNTVAAATKGIIVKAAVSQTANLTEWQNSSGTALATINSVGKLSLNNIATTGTSALDITSPTGDNGASRQGVNISATGGAPNGVYTAYYANVTGHSDNYGLYIQNGDAYINGFLDLNNNSFRNVGNCQIGGISTSTVASLQINDKTVGSSAGLGGDIIFCGDDRNQGSTAGVFAGIRGIKENSVYLDHKGALVFYVCPTSGPLDGTAGSKTDLTEVGRFSSAGYLGIGATDPVAPLHVYGGLASNTLVNLQGYAGSDYHLDISSIVGIATVDYKISSTDFTGGVQDLLYFDSSNGNVGIAETAPGSRLQINTVAAATTGLIIKAAASQTANLLEWQNSSGTVMSSISPSGRLYVGSGTDYIEFTSSTITNKSQFGDRFRLISNGSISLGMPAAYDAGALELSINTGRCAIGGGGTGAGYLTFWTNTDYTVPKMVLNTSGNLGIGLGLSGASAKLHVSTATAATIGFIVQATTSQTANLTEWRNSSGTVLAYVAADGSSSFGGTITVEDLNIESLGTADSTNTTYNSENLTWNGSYWDGAAAQNTNAVVKLATGITENYLSITPDDRTAGEYKFYPDEFTAPGDIVANGIIQTTTATNVAWFEAVKPAAYQLSGFRITDGTDDFIYMQDSGTVANRVGIYSGGGRDLEFKTELNASKTIRLQASTIYLTDADTPYADMVTVTDGKLGIGVTPTYALSLAEGTAATAGIRFGTDTTLYRNTADSLKTDDSFTVAVDLRVNSIKDITGSDWLMYYTSDDLYIGASSSGLGPVDLVVFRNSGNVGIGATAPGAKLEVETGAAGTKGLIVQGAASQTANLTEWQDSSGTVIAAVSKDGNASFGGDAGASYKLTLQGTGAITQRIYSTNNAGDTTIRFDGAGYRGAISANASYKLKINSNNDFGSGAVWINDVDDSDVVLVTGGGNVGVGTSTPGYKLEVNGSFAATTKSFVIDHPTKPGKKLRHGSLEGPENGVYYRGRTRSSIIELPEYWKGLVDEDSITVHLTAIGKTETPKVKSVYENIICIENETLGSIDCYFVVYGERKDVEKLQVEIDGN